MKPLITALACGVLALVAPGVSAQSASPSVTYADGLLTVHAINAPLGELFDHLERLGVVEVVGRDRLTGTVSVDITSRPIQAALSELLADFNFAVTSRRARANQSIPVYVVRVHSRRDAAPARTGPITIPALDAARAAEQEPDTPDPDEDPDEQAEREAEEADRLLELTQRERAGHFDASLPVDDLAELLDEDNPLIRARALLAINARDSRAAIPHLLRGLGDDDGTVRDQAIDLLGRRTDDESLRQLGETLVQDEDTSRRIHAFIALAMRADSNSLRFVEAVANDPNPVIKSAAASFLAEMARRRTRGGDAA